MVTVEVRDKSERGVKDGAAGKERASREGGQEEGRRHGEKSGIWVLGP